MAETETPKKKNHLRKWGWLYGIIIVIVIYVVLDYHNKWMLFPAPWKDKTKYPKGKGSVKEIVNKIKADATWLKNVTNKATANSVSLDTQLKNDAVFWLQSQGYYPYDDM